MQQVVAVERASPGEVVDEFEALFGAVGHRDGDRAVERDDRRRQTPVELVVQPGDLRPVGVRRRRGLRVDGGDGRLQHVRPRRAGAQRVLDQAEALGDLLAIPEAPVLVVEQHEIAVAVGARLAPRVLQQHEGEESGRLRLVGHEPARQPGEPDGFAAELAALQRVAAGRRVALVEDEIQGREHGGESLGQRVVGRHAEGDGGVADLALGAHQALGDRRLGQEEGARDLRGGQAAEEPQGERDLRLGPERRVAHEEDEAQAVVLHRARRFSASSSSSSGSRVMGLASRSQQAQLVGIDAAPAQHVQGAVARGLEDPRRGVGRQPRSRPAVERRHVGVLDSVLGEVDVAEDADEDGDGAPGLLAEQPGGRLAGV